MLSRTLLTEQRAPTHELTEQPSIQGRQSQRGLFSEVMLVMNTQQLALGGACRMGGGRRAAAAAVACR